MATGDSIDKGKGLPDSAARKRYEVTGKHDVKDKRGKQSEGYTAFLKAGGGGRAAIDAYMSKSGGNTPTGGSYGAVSDKASQSVGMGSTSKAFGFMAGVAPDPFSPRTYGAKDILKPRTVGKLPLDWLFSPAMDAGRMIGVPVTPVEVAIKGAWYGQKGFSKSEDLGTRDYMNLFNIGAETAFDVAPAATIKQVSAPAATLSVDRTVESASSYISGTVERYTDIIHETVTGDGGMLGEAKDLAKYAALGLGAILLMNLTRR